MKFVTTLLIAIMAVMFVGCATTGITPNPTAGFRFESQVVGDPRDRPADTNRQRRSLYLRRQHPRQSPAGYDHKERQGQIRRVG